MDCLVINLLWSEVFETNATFRAATTGLDHILVACDLTHDTVVGLYGGGRIVSIPDHGVW